MIVLVFSACYIPGYKGGGPIKTIRNLFEQTGDAVSFKLITSDRDLGDQTPYKSVAGGAWNCIESVPVFYAQSGLRGMGQIFRIVCEGKYDVIYTNSFFSARFAIFPFLLAKALRRKILVAPRGEFSGGALGLKAAKKSIFLGLYKLFGLGRLTIFQASSDYEAEDIFRVLGPKVDIKVAENIGSQEYADTLVLSDQASIRAVSVSRITPMKNLLGAIEMLALVQSSVTYDIYGPVEDHSYWLNCQEKIKALPSRIRVNYRGSLSPQDVVKTIAGYDVFYLPTKGENYGHVIAEALCAGLPLLIANTTPWRELEEKRLGWDLSLDHPTAFSSAIDKLAAMSPTERLEMRNNVLAWAKDKFSQREVIEANIDMFRYVYEKK